MRKKIVTVVLIAALALESLSGCALLDKVNQLLEKQIAENIEVYILSSYLLPIQ